jgi:hypothetical protein
LPILEGSGRCPPVLGEKTRWAIEHKKKYPEPGGDNRSADEQEWVFVEAAQTKDSLFFI